MSTTPFLGQHSAVFTMAAEIYQRHTLDPSGRCGCCGGRPCPVRHNCATVIRAAGIDPAVFEPAPHAALTDPTVPLPQVASDQGHRAGQRDNAVRTTEWWTRDQSEAAGSTSQSPTS